MIHRGLSNYTNNSLNPPNIPDRWYRKCKQRLESQRQTTQDRNSMLWHKWTNPEEFVDSQWSGCNGHFSSYWTNRTVFIAVTEGQLYQVLIGWESVSPLLHSTGWPPLLHNVSTFIWWILREGCPGVVWLVERAVRLAWRPEGRLTGDSMVSKCCYQTHTQAHAH